MSEVASSPSQSVLEGLDASRRAAWAKYYALRRVLMRVEGMLFAFRDWPGGGARHIVRLASYELQRSINEQFSGEYEAEFFNGAEAALAEPLRPGGVGRVVRVGWPTGAGRCQ